MESTHVFELRKEAKDLSGNLKLNKLNEALNIAINLYKEEPFDEWIQKALAWTLIDLCKYYIAINNTAQATNYLNQLLSINFQDEDKIIENQKSFLQPKIDINYNDVKRAEELSKTNKHSDAIGIINNLIVENRLSEIHHESYGWIIYRYIKNEANNLTSIQVRTFFRDYMNLKNVRPSLLHSMILNFAMYYSKEHSDFNLYKFFKLWNPKNLRSEDKSKQSYDEKEIPSLLSRIFREFIEKKYNVDIEYLIDNVIMSSWNDNEENKQKVLDLLREPIFWQIFNAKKENKFSDLWALFNNYNLQFSKFPKSKWHSEILSLAERYMQETDEWRFLEFFKEWNPINFLVEDWEEVKKDENTYKPLAIKCLKKSYNIIKTQNTQTENNDWLIEVYQVATLKFPKDEWLSREKALLLIRKDDLDQAIEIYKNLVLSLGDKAYIWSEFSSCFKNNNDLKIGMLSKAILLEKNEDFLGDIHLELAKALTENNLIDNSIIELSKYKKHREKKGWKLSETYTVLNSKISDNQTSLKNNQTLYDKHIPLAEEYAYQDIDWSDFVLVDKWKNDKNKDRCKFSNGKEIEFSIGRQRFKSIREANVGNIYKFKLHVEEKEVDEKPTHLNWSSRFSTPIIEYKYIPLLSQTSEKSDWSILEDEIAVIDYINKEKKVVHAITSKNEEIFFKEDIKKYSVSNFIQGKRLATKWKGETRIELKSISLIENSIGIKKFQKVIAIVDNVNQKKGLFHFVADRSIHGIVRFNETELRPIEGSFLEIWIAKKTDNKRNKVIYKPLDIKETAKTNDKLLKTVQGLLVLSPNFGFVCDIYVPKYILNKYSIETDCMVTAKAIFSGDKWKIIELETDDTSLTQDSMRIVEIKTTPSMDKNLFINTDLTDEQILDVIWGMREEEIVDDFIFEKEAYINKLKITYSNSKIEEVIE